MGPLGRTRTVAGFVTATLLVSAAVVAVPSAAAAEEADFVRITVDVPSDGSTVSLSWSITALHFGPAPLIAGQALGLRNGAYRGGVATAQRLQTGGGTSASLLGSSISWAPLGTRWEISTANPMTVYPVDDDGQLDLVVFVPGGTEIEVNSVEVDAPEGTTTTVTTGHGAHTVAVGDPEDAASLVTVNGVVLGSSDVSRDVESGITGAIVTGSCVSCNGSWQSPESDLSWTWRMPGEANGWDNRQHFKGPGGEWRWMWRGEQAHATDGAPVYAAYVEVGDDWRSF